MAIGTISSPASWLIGTVAAPTWFQNAQDNINGLIAGTGPTLKALQIDGVGGAASAAAPGTLSVSGIGNISGSVNGKTYSNGIIGKDLIPAALGVVSINSSGPGGVYVSSGSSYNMSAANARAGVGWYNMQFANTPSASGFVVVCSFYDNNASSGIVTVSASVSVSSVQFFTYNGSVVRTDPSAIIQIGFVVYAVN